MKPCKLPPKTPISTSPLTQRENPLRKEPAYLVYVGTYTENSDPVGEKSEGIYVFRMEPVDGSLSLIQVMSGVVNPSFLAIHPSRRYLYAVNEVGQFEGKPGGGVSAFSIHPQTGELALLNQQLSQGVDPCYLSVDQSGKKVLVANYSSGNLSMLPIKADGKLLPAIDVVQHHGSGLDPVRQEAAHVHSVILDPEERFLIVADLGLDKLFIYQFDPGEAKLVLHTSPWMQVKAGAGPRHLDFHPNGRYAYLLNELNSTLWVCAYRQRDGSLQEIQVIPTLPNGFEGINWAADVHVRPDGRFVYASNRGHDSIVIYAVDEKSGRLDNVGYEATQGSYPRNFAIDPSGRYLLVANQRSGIIVSFLIDESTGKLSPTGQVINVPAPVCILFLKEEQDVGV